MRKAQSSGGDSIGCSFKGGSGTGSGEDGDEEDGERSDRSFRAAVDDLYGSIRAGSSGCCRSRTVRDMRVYLNRIGPLRLPPCVHIAGTKGKGSTAALCEAVLRGRYRLGTGLFTSPHLVDVRERIRVGGRPVSEEVFARAYWRVRRRLLSAAERNPFEGVEDDLPPPPPLPGYFRMLTLLALYVFANHRDPSVDVMIVEVGMGGRHDATNVLEGPKVCGIALLDYDHVQVLGSTLEQIAAEKAGIYSGSAPDRSGSECYVLDTNLPSSLEVIREHVEQRAGVVRMVGRHSHPALPSEAKLGLPGRHQRDNAELAIALCRAAVRRFFPEADKSSREQEPRHATGELDGEPDARKDDPLLLRALAGASWPGRCQAVVLPEMTLYLDGAHTPQSIASGLEWFLEQVNATESPKDAASDTIALVFSCSHERNPVELLELLCRPGVFQLAVFARPDSEKPSAEGKPTAEALLAQNGIAYRPELRVLGDRDGTGAAPQSWQDSLATAWRHLATIRGRDPGGDGTAPPGPRLAAGAARHPSPEVVSSVSVPQALQALRERGDSASAGAVRTRHVRVLVTGSLYLVGSVLSAVGWNEEDATGFL